MGENDSQKNQILRQKAEERLNKENLTIFELGPQETQKLVHELRTHQIELELQNEELRRTQTALEDSRNRYLDLFDFAPIGYVAVDQLGRIIEANIALAKMLAGERRALAQKQFSDFIVADHQDTYYLHHRHTLQSGSPQSCRLRMIRTGEGPLWVELDSIRVGAGDEAHLRTAILDISELRKTEAELVHSQKLQAIGTFAGGIAHHLNNLLHVILGYTQMTMESLPSSAKEHESLQLVVQSAQSGRDLVKDLLVFCRTSDSEKEMLDLSVFLVDTVKLLRGIIPSSVEIRLDIAPTCGCVAGHAGELRQVVMNILANAHQSLDAPDGVIDLTLEEVVLPVPGLPLPIGLPEGKYGKISVRDNGCGMDEETLVQVIEPFFTTKDPGEGTGLGLSISHGIVANHGGWLTINSKLGEGTEVQVFLPICQEEVKTQEPIPPQTGNEVQGNLRIMYVDDEVLIIELAQAQLSRAGHSVSVFQSGVEALQAFQDAPDSFDLVITDQSMPQMAGTDLAAKIMAIRPQVPIILLSGLKVEVGSELQGIRKVLTKPIEGIDLIAAIQEVVVTMAKTRK